MANTKTVKRVEPKGKTYKFATLKREAEKRAEGRAPGREIAPFVLDDVEPPIVITAPDTVERKLIIADCIGRDGTFSATSTLPLLKALCGEQFGRVWMLVKDDTEPDTLLLFIQTLLTHFNEALVDVQGAAEAPGGTSASSS